MNKTNTSTALVDKGQLLEHVPAVVFRLTHVDGRWNTLFVTQNISMYGYTAEEFTSGALSWNDIVHPDDLVLALKTVRDYEAHNISSFRLNYRVVTRNGDSVPVTEYNTLNRDAQGRLLSYDTVLMNNTMLAADRAAVDDHLRQQLVLNDILMSLHASDLDHALQIILDQTGRYLDTSRALLFKDSPDHKTCKVIYEWDNKDITSVMDLDYSITYETGMPEIYVALQTTGNLLINYGEIPENCKEEFDAEGLVASAIFAIYLNGEHFGFVCFDDCVVERVWDEDTVRFLKNISNLISTVVARQYAAQQLAESQQAVAAMAFTDHLTGLANRYSCDVELQSAIDKARRAGGSGWLLFIDMDDFKIVNDCYGHDYGDAILKSLAGWLREAFPPPAGVFRFGGDEFVLMTDTGDDTPLEQLVERLHTRAQKPWQSLDKAFYCTLSVGVVPYSGASPDSKTVIKHADIAMYEAKRQGKNSYKLYDESLGGSSVRRSETEALLRRAMENNFEGFDIHYQPIVDAATGRITGAEALLRMKDGERVVMPQEFLPLAEYLGFILPIGEHVLKTAAAECRRINQSGLPGFKMTVNISARQLKQKDILARLEDILDASGVDYRSMVLSVKESAALEDIERMKAVCGRMRQLGLSVTLDDFGGGSASFLQLNQLPVDTITTATMLMEKLDDRYTRDFIELIIKLCHSMDKQVCINGIETEAQYHYAAGCGADLLQGFHLYTAAGAHILRGLL